MSTAELRSLVNLQSIEKISWEQLDTKGKLERDFYLHELKEAMFGRIEAGKEKHLSELLFYKIIGGDAILKQDQKDLSFLVGDEETPWHQKCLVVSALTISLIGQFDKVRLRFLLKFLLEEEEQVWQRALVGIVLGLFEREHIVQEQHPQLLKQLEGLKSRDFVQTGIQYLMDYLNEIQRI